MSLQVALRKMERKTLQFTLEDHTVRVYIEMAIIVLLPVNAPSHTLRKVTVRPTAPNTGRHLQETSLSEQVLIILP